MVASRTRAGMLAVLLACGGCAGTSTSSPAVVAATPIGALRVAVEGPCSKLSMNALGDRRVLVYGDTGYDLRGWSAGDTLAAAQSLVELRADRLYRNRKLLAGLPQDEGGYVPAELLVGSGSGRGAWLLLVTTRYAPFERGMLFEREVGGYTLGALGWQSSASELPVDLPVESAALPRLDRATLCAEPGLTFVPLAASPTPQGGMLVAGQCDSPGPVKHRDTTLLVVHGRAQARQWQALRLPETSELDANVNLDLYARSDDDAFVSVVEPFTPRERRHAYLARFDGRSWTPQPIELGDGIMSIDGEPDGTLWLAAGRALYHGPPEGPFAREELPALRFTSASPADLHVHTVHVLGPGELWVEASYRVELPAPDGKGTAAVWAAALYGTAQLAHPIYCDARRPAEEALVEIE